MKFLSKEEIEKRVSDSYELVNNVIEAVPKPMVTIRTSTYQHGPYIKECIEGVLMQKTNFPIEFIIGEDFSTDGTREIVFEYAKKYPDIIRVFTADYNVGSKANGKRCIGAARGKYMALCEGDDYWTDPLKLQKQVDFLEANDDYGLIHGSCDFYHQDKNIWTRNSNKNLKNDTHVKNYKEQFDLLVNGSYKIRTASVLFRKNLLEDYKKINSPKFLMGDTPMWLVFSQLTKFKYLSEVLSVYRIHGNSITNSKNLIRDLRFKVSSIEMRLFYSIFFKIEIKESLRKIYNEKLLLYKLYDCNYMPLYPLIEPTKKELFVFNNSCNFLLNKIFRFEMKLTNYLKQQIQKRSN